MKLLFDYLPIIFFFIAYKIAGIYIATGVAMATLFIQIAFCLWKYRKVDTTQWINLGLLTIFGGATLILHDMIFIKWKVTIVYWVFGLILLASQAFRTKNILKALMGKQLTLPENVWQTLSYAWATFFMVLGAVNIYVIYHYTTEQWVNFKLFGTLGLILVFCALQAVYINKYLPKDPDKTNKEDQST